MEGRTSIRPHLGHVRDKIAALRVAVSVIIQLRGSAMTRPAVTSCYETVLGRLGVSFG